jgi:hypothetical protein
MRPCRQPRGRAPTTPTLNGVATSRPTYLRELFTLRAPGCVVQGWLVPGRWVCCSAVEVTPARCGDRSPQSTLLPGPAEAKKSVCHSVQMLSKTIKYSQRAVTTTRRSSWTMVATTPPLSLSDRNVTSHNTEVVLPSRSFTGRPLTSRNL